MQVQSLSWEIPWRRTWKLTPVFLPGESHGQTEPAGYNPWGRKESGRTEATQHALLVYCLTSDIGKKSERDTSIYHFKKLFPKRPLGKRKMKYLFIYRPSDPFRATLPLKCSVLYNLLLTGQLTSWLRGMKVGISSVGLSESNVIQKGKLVFLKL